MTGRRAGAVVALVAIVYSACDRASAPTPLALVGATLIDVRDGAHRTNITILIDDGKIVRVGAAADVPVARQARRVDVAGKFVIPGLWDTHVHIQNARELTVFVPLLVAHGVTSIRDVEGLLPSEYHRLGGSQPYMPRVVACGTYIDGQAPKGAANDAIVDELAAKGVDCIKVGSLLPRERFEAIAARARALRLPLVGHVPVAVNAGDASDAGTIGSINGVSARG